MPVDRGTIEQQLNELGENVRWWEQRELRDLPAALHAGEQILAIARGKFGGSGFLRSWLIVVTDRRVLCLRSGSGLRRQQIELPTDQIRRVWMGVGVFRGRVQLMVGGDKYRLLLRRSDAYKLLNVLSTMVKPQPAPAEGFWPNRMVGRVFRHVLELPTVALNPGTTPPAIAPPPSDETTDRRLQLLEEQVQHLQQQVDFLEQLLQPQHATRD